MNRRLFLRSCSGVAGLALLAACAPQSPGAPAAPTSAPTAAAPAASTSGSLLRVALASQITTLDGHVLNQQAIDTTWHIFDRLTEYDAKLQPQPSLAESWQVSPDARQITFHLRQGVKFHSGREMTSDDIKANILRVRDPNVKASQLIPQSAWWTTIDTPDPRTITLTSDAPRPAMFDFFEYLNILDPQSWQGPDAATKAVGTGPFTFVEWMQGDHLTLKRNPSYWQAGTPKVDQVVYAFTRDAQAMVTQLESSAADLVINPALIDAARLRGNSSFQFTTSTTAGTFQEFIVNTRAPGLDNPKVRQALNYAMDRGRMLTNVRKDIGQVQALPWASSSPAYDVNKNLAYAFDLGKARAALDQSGVSGVSLDLVYATGGDAPDFAQIFQSDLGQIGITATLKPADGPAARQAMTDGKYSLYFTPHPFASMNPISMITSPYFDAKQNMSAYTDDAYAQTSTALLTETDPTKLKALYSTLNDELLDASFSLVISPAPPIALAGPNVQGLRYDLHDALVLREVGLA
jgi:peptide/nickel transport system substrate-binding protein